MLKDGVGRKFVGAMFMQISNICLLYIGAITSADFKAMTVGVFGMYILGNIGQRYTDGMKK